MEEEVKGAGQGKVQGKEAKAKDRSVSPQFLRRVVAAMRRHRAGLVSKCLA